MAGTLSTSSKIVFSYLVKIFFAFFFGVKNKSNFSCTELTIAEFPTHIQELKIEAETP